MKQKRFAPPILHQRGLSLISVLVAIVVFSIGMLSIASIYSLAVPAATANEESLEAAAFGNQFWAVLQANPNLANVLFGAAPPIGTSVSYTSNTPIGSVPSALQPLLTNVFINPLSRLPPPATVTIGATNNANGTACTAQGPTPACGVTLIIQWTPSASNPRKQSFNYQVGF